MPRSIGRNAARADDLIEQAYRQIFFHAFKVDRDAALKSQLRSGQITVRDFVRGLLLSSKFRDDFYRCKSNDRMVDQIIGRVLGRQVHGDRERIALSIVIAQRGLPGLLDSLLESEEYLTHFGLNSVPYQRSRSLAGRCALAPGAPPLADPGGRGRLRAHRPGALHRRRDAQHRRGRLSPGPLAVEGAIRPPVRT